MKHLKSTTFMLAAVMLLVVMLLSGCNQQAPTTAPTSAPVEAVATEAPAEAPTEAPAEAAATEAPAEAAATEAPAETTTGGAMEEAMGDHLTVALSNLEAETFLPWNGGGGRAPYLTMIYDNLFYVDPDTEEVLAGLATGWTMSDDATVWTLQIREGVQFHEGWGELTAEDVKYSIERLLDEESVAGPSRVLRAIVEKVEAPEPYKVVITLNAPNPELLRGYLTNTNQTLIVSKAYVESVGDEEANTHPIGTGPYTLAAEHQQAGPIELKTIEGVENHWRVTPKFQTVTFLGVPEEATRVAMLQTGEADLAPVSYDSIQTIKDAGLNIISIHDNWAPVIRLGGMVTTDPARYNPENPWADERVRQALNYAIDKQTIADTIFQGEARPAGSGDPVPPYLQIEPYPYDPDKARELLVEAGYPDGFDITLKTFTTTPGAELPTLAEAVALYWNEIGVNVTIVPTDWGTVRGEWSGGQALDYVWTHRGLVFGDPLSPLDAEYRDASAFAAYSTEDTVTGLKKLASELDSGKRDQLALEFGEARRDEAAFVFLVYANEPYGASDKIQSWPTIRARPQNIDFINQEFSADTPTMSVEESAAISTEAPAEMPARESPEGELTVALSTFAEDTFLPWNGGVARQSYLGLIYDFLLYADPETAEPQPGLATTWEMSPDGMTWTFNLREGVQFHEGWGELTAEDVKYSIERMMDDNSVGSPKSQLQRIVDKVEAPDPYQVVITLQSPYAELDRSLIMDYNAAGMVVSKEYVESVGDEEANAHPIGTGPYTLAEPHQQAEPIKLKTIEGVENHWRVTPQYETVTFLLVPEEATRVAMLLAGEADLAPISYDSVDTVAGADGLHVVSIPQNWVPLIWFGGIVQTNPDRYVPDQPWADVKVRQALNYAVDRATIAETIFHGEATPAGTSNPVPGWIDIEPYPYDPDKAMELLAEAGYPDGFPLTLKTLTANPGAELPTIGEAVALYWDAIGIDVTIVPTDWGSVRDELLGAQANDYFFTQRGQPFAEALTPATIFYAPQGPFTSYASEESAALAGQLTTELDAGKREELAHQFGQLLHDDAAGVFIVYANEPYGASEKVGQWPTIRMRPQNIELITGP